MKKKLVMVGVIALVMLATVGMSGCIDETLSKDYNVIVTDAPNGRYWVHTEGRGGGGFLVFWFYLNSDLRESYTVKFMDGNEYKTLIISSGDPRLHVIFTNDNTTMQLHIYAHIEEKDIGAQYDGPLDAMNMGINSEGYAYYRDCIYIYKFTLYIPRPEICIISNETGE
jgi:hypothetical protein